MIVNANLSSLSAQRMLFENSKAASTAMERLATGSKINKAQDDVAGFAIADRMTSQVRGLNMAVKNVNDAMAMLSVADSAASDITDMLQRMRELAIQAASDTNSAAERQYLQDEVDSLIQEIDRVATQTQYNGENLLDGSKNASFQIGASSGQTVAFEFRSLAVSSFTPATLAQTLDVSGGSATMNLSIDYQEENEIQFSGGYFRHVETGAIRQWQGYNFQDRTDKAVTWSSNTKSGEWELAHLYLQDNFGNRTELFSDDLQELGINFSVEVIGGSEDFDPPVITSFSADKHSLDISGGSATMNLSIDYQEENEIQFSGGYFRHVETGAIRQWQGYNFQDRTDKAVTWSSNTKSGEWELAHLYLQDNFGNRTELFPDDLQELGINFSVEVIGGSEDFDPPVITSFSADKHSLDISGGSATMNLSIDYQEENEIQFSGGYFRHVETGAIRQWQGYNFQDRTDKAVTWSSNTKSGEWELAHLYLQDNFGNRTELFSDDLQELGINFSVEVIGGSEDFDPPVITSFIAEIPANPESGDANSGDTSSTSTLTSDKFHLLGNTEATAAIVQITAAIETVTAQRAEYGAMQNRLQYTISNLMSVSENTVAARSRIEDANFATESAVLAKSQVLQQSGAAMLAQANARPQLVLQLIK